MKTLRILFIVAASFVSLRNVGAQDFVNLDFETAQIIPLPNTVSDHPGNENLVAVTNALPGWQVTYENKQGAVSVSSITYGHTSPHDFLSTSLVSMVATNGSQISGNFSVELQGHVSVYSSVAISQTGLVSAGTESILFKASGQGTLDLTLDGNAIAFSPIASDANYTLYAGDVSAYAGQTETLSFSIPLNQYGVTSWELDDIQFSPLPAPEPGTLSLLSVAALIIFWRAKWSKSASAAK